MSSLSEMLGNFNPFKDESKNRFNLNTSDTEGRYNLTPTQDTEQQRMLAVINEAIQTNDFGQYDAGRFDLETITDELGLTPFEVESLMTEATIRFEELMRKCIDHAKANYEPGEMTPGVVANAAIRELSTTPAFIEWMRALPPKFVMVPVIASMLWGMFAAQMPGVSRAAGAERSPITTTYTNEEDGGNETETLPSYSFEPTAQLNVRSGPGVNYAWVRSIGPVNKIGIVGGSAIMVDGKGGQLSPESVKTFSDAQEVWLMISTPTSTKAEWISFKYQGNVNGNLTKIVPPQQETTTQPEQTGGAEELDENQMKVLEDSLFISGVFTDYPTVKPATLNIKQNGSTFSLLSGTVINWEIRSDDKYNAVINDKATGTPIFYWAGSQEKDGVPHDVWKPITDILNSAESVPDWFGGFELNAKTNQGELVLTETAQQAFYSEFVKVLAAQQQVSISEMTALLEENGGKVQLRTLKEAPGVLSNLEIYFPALNEDKPVLLDLNKPINILSSDVPVGFRLNMAQSMQTSKGLEPIWFSVNVAESGQLEIRIMKPFVDQLTDPTKAKEAIEKGKLTEDDFANGYRLSRGGSVSMILAKLFETYARINDLPPTGEVWSQANIEESGKYLTDIWWGGKIDPNKRIFKPQIIDLEAMYPMPEPGEKYPNTGHITVKYSNE